MVQSTDPSERAQGWVQTLAPHLGYDCEQGISLPYALISSSVKWVQLLVLKSCCELIV